MKNKINKVINITYLVMLVIGIIMTMAGIGLKITDNAVFEERSTGLIILASAIMTGFCAVSLIRRKKSAEYAEQEDMESIDERSIQVRGKAHTVSWHITDLLLVIGIFKKL